MIQLEAHELGVILPVRAQPGSKQNRIKGEQDGALKVSVTQIAEKRKANQALRAVICKQLNLRKSQVELISGEISSQKRFLIREILVEDLRQKIDRCLGT